VHALQARLCNDRQVLGPWLNGRKTNLFTTAVFFPAITAGRIFAIMIGCALLGLAVASVLVVVKIVELALGR